MLYRRAVSAYISDLTSVKIRRLPGLIFLYLPWGVSLPSSHDLLGDRAGCACSCVYLVALGMGQLPTTQLVLAVVFKSSSFTLHTLLCWVSQLGR